MGRAGQHTTNLTGKLAYKSFKPASLPPTPELQIDNQLNNKIKQAYLLLGRLDGASKLIPNKDIYISMYVRKEALLSSQIEGTQATMDDILNPAIDENTNSDVNDVIQYLKANKYAHKLLETLPISMRFIKQVHETLLSSHRESDKEPGEVRRTQNWIGPQEKSLKDARFVPPNVNDMLDALHDLELYIHNDETTDPLVRIALIHYQFETIHPFLDGNGRIGRLLIGFLLRQYNLLTEDTLYLSYFLKKNRIEYYDRLMDVRLKGHFEAWVDFFVSGVIETAKHALDTIDSLNSLHMNNVNKITLIDAKNKLTVMKLFEYIEEHPLIDIKGASHGMNKAYNTIASAIKTLEKMRILKKVNDGRRNRIYVYEEYLDILRDGTD